MHNHDTAVPEKRQITNSILRIHNGEKQVLRYMVLRNLDRYMQKNQTGVLSHTMFKSKLKMDKNVNVKSETTKLKT